MRSFTTACEPTPTWSPPVTQKKAILEAGVTDTDGL
jgi:hypothetical protein